MSKAGPPSLWIHAAAGSDVLAQHPSRVDDLLRDIALWRGALGAWQDRIARYHAALEPVRRELHAAWREWVFALDHASLQPGLSRAEREQLHDLIREAATPLLEWEDDPELAAVARRHGEDTRSVPPAPDAAGDGTEAEELPADPAQDWEQQAAAAAARRAERAAQRRAASASKRRAKDAQAVAAPLRDVYRRLASALHPDREPDAQQRERKTAWMQQANLAYAEEDLSALIDLQRRTEHIDAARPGSMDRQRLAHYVTLLEAQLADLQSATRRLEAEFREATGLPAGSGLQPRKADRMISSESRRLRDALQSLRRETASLLDVEGVKAWLRERRGAQVG